MAVLTGSSTAEIDAPLEQVWALVEDVERAPEWQGGLKRMHALERDDEGHATLCQAEADLKVRTVKSTVRFTYTGPTTLAWRQEKGELHEWDHPHRMIWYERCQGDESWLSRPHAAPPRQQADRRCPGRRVLA
jgi:hypothetical protein